MTGEVSSDTLKSETRMMFLGISRQDTASLLEDSPAHVELESS